MIESQWFSISTEVWAIAFAIFLIVACLVLSFIALKRTGFKRAHCFLEFLRLMMVGLVALAVCQPEWLQKFMPISEPTMVVLWDESESMDTVDVVDAKEPQKPAQSRAKSIQSLIETDYWNQFAGGEDSETQLKVVIEPFSSSLAKPKKRFGSKCGAGERIRTSRKLTRGRAGFRWRLEYRWPTHRSGNAASHA